MIALAALADARGWLKVAKWAVPAAAIAILAAVVWWMSTVIDRTRIERDAAVADVRDFRRTVTDATVPLAANGERPLLSTADAKAALVGAFRDRDDARASLATISRDTRAARARADRADATLAQTQAANLRRLGAAQSRIDELERARPAPTAAENTAAIDTDSKAAWEAWR